MKKASQIAHDIVVVVNQITDLKWQLDDAWKKFKALQKELAHHIKFNRTIKLD